MISLQDSGGDLTAQPWAISCCWLSMHRASEGYAGYIFFSPRGAEGVLLENSTTSLVLQGFSQWVIECVWMCERTECNMCSHTQSSSLMPIEGIDIFSTTLPTTLMHMLVSSMRKKPMILFHYYSCPVFCSVAESNATVGYQFIALAPGKLFGKQRDFQPVCNSSSSGARRCKKCWFKELYLKMFERVRYEERSKGSACIVCLLNFFSLKGLRWKHIDS